MGPKRMMHAGEAGLTGVVEGMAKVREALPDGIREAADRRLGGNSALGKGVRSMVDTVVAESAKARASRAALAVEVAAAATAAAAAAEEKALAMVAAADTSAKDSGGRGRKVLLAGLALGAAAGGAYLVWKRRQQAARDHLSGEAQWAPAGGSTVADLSARVSAEADEADVAPDIDEADVVEADVVEDAGLDTASDLADEASEAAGDTRVAPRSFNEQIDEVADSLSADVVAAIETPKGGVPGS